MCRGVIQVVIFVSDSLHSAWFFSRFICASLEAPMVKNPPAMQETQVQSLGQKEPLEEGAPVLLPGESHGQRSLVACSP